MAKKLSSVLLSTFKRVSRMQRDALKLAQSMTSGTPRKPRKTARKTARKTSRQGAAPGLAREGSRPASMAPDTGSRGSRAARPRPNGKGRWQDLIHQTAPSHNELLGRLAYGLYLPQDGADAGMPLLIMLHGCQQSAHDIAAGSRMNELADEKGFVVAYPQQAKRVQSMRCWHWFQPDRAHGLAEAAAIADLAGSLVRKYRLDPARVYIAGLSAGAGMAALALLRHPEVFAAGALHSGAVLGAAHNASAGLKVMRNGATEDPAPLLVPLLGSAGPYSGRPVVVLHGERDRVVSTRNATQLAEQFAALNGATAIRHSVLGEGTHRQYVRHDFMDGGRVLVRLCLLKEVGHAWSGGDPRLKFNSERGPRASALIWQFFAMQNRVPAIPS